ncbi:PA14 domain-containing protein [Desertibaculum subflavum]|uniref:PA14 domain-containing protein n=1 Tax=Desertibaculum subflavum TaxID=2268458 RepID=UPI0013C4806A
MNGVTTAILATLTGLAFASGVAAAPMEVAPATVSAEALKPGIRVSYWYAAFEHVDQFEKLIAEKPGWTPKPLAALDDCGGNGKLYEAGVIENYGIRGEGFLRFGKAGEYQIVAKSNDGIRLKLDGRLALEDPKVHGDRMSKPAVVKVSAPGLVPFDFNYFQKKGGACLQLYWQEPGQDKLSLVPPEAFLHQPK